MRPRFRRATAIAIAAAVTFASAPTAFAQTQGMQRRDNRRDTRQMGRATKQACKAGDEKTRAECRQAKRQVKQQRRQGGGPPPQAPPAQ